MNKRLRTKNSNINIVSLMMIIGLLVFSMSGCQRVNDPASGNKAINNNTTTNSNTVNVNANANSNAGANANNTVAANGSANADTETAKTDREQIMDALRAPVEKELKQEIKFKVGSLKIAGDWAFMAGEPLNKASGKRPDLTGTEYDEENWEDFDNNIFALLKKKGGSWTVVERAMMCSDVCYEGWDKKHGAPKEIF